MPSAGAKDFRQYSEGIVREFLQTIMVVDDRAYFEEKESMVIPTQVAVPGAQRFTIAVRSSKNPAESSAKSEYALQDETDTNSEPDEKESLVDKAHELNAKRLIEDFAVKGIACAVIRPKDVEVESLSDKVYPLAGNCDIVMFDWVLCGATDGGKVKELISEITKRSSSDNEKRLRLIVVYTGQEELAAITSEIKTVLEETGQLEVTNKNDYTLEAGPVRIAVYAKGYVPVSEEHAELAARVVPIEQMPDKLIAEFTDMAMGLVSNVAIGSMAALRSNTHRILTKFHPGIDAPFLAHRAMLPHPDDANDLLVYLIGAELTAVLEGHELGKIADRDNDIDIIRAWVEMNEAEMEGTSERGFAKKFSIGNTSDFIKSLCELLRCGFSGDALPVQFLSMKDAPQKGKLTKKLSRSQTPDAALEHEFAALTTLKSDYRTTFRPPALLPGTVLKALPPVGDATQKSRYWVCIQPACDCVRLEEPRLFPFLELARDDGNFNLVLPDNNDFVRVRVVYKPHQLQSVHFAPTEGSNMVRGVRSDEGIHFAATDTSRFLWIAELKFEQAQRIINKYSSIQSRVGLDESEWLRRSALGTNVDE
jgi:hypothetical protein